MDLAAAGSRRVPLEVMPLAVFLARFPAVAARAERWTRFAAWQGLAKHKFRPAGATRNEAVLREYTICVGADKVVVHGMRERLLRH